MEGFTVVDAVVLGVVALSAILAYARGISREILAIAAWIGAAIGAFLFAPVLAPLMREVPVLRDIIAGSCELGILAAFAVVFAGALILFSVFTPLIGGAVANSALGPVDKGLGFLFGVARGVLLVLIAFLVYEQVAGSAGVAAIDQSRSRAIFTDVEADVANQLPQGAPGWVQARYSTLVGACQ